MSSDPVVLHKRRDTKSILAGLFRIGVAILGGLLVVSVYLFLYAPPIVTAIFSFNSSDIQTLPFAHWTLKWYTALLNDPQMQSAIYYSLEAGLTAVAVGAVFGVAFALLIHRLRFAGRNVVQALLAAPLAVFHSRKRYVIALAIITFFSFTIAFGVEPMRWIVSHIPVLKGIKNNRSPAKPTTSASIV